MRDLVDTERAERSIGKKITLNPNFDLVAGALIFANAVLIGFQTDYQARDPTRSCPVIFVVLDTLFCIAFSAELSLRIYTYGQKFFLGRGWKWNVFDTMMVALQVIDLVTQLIVRHTGAASNANSKMYKLSSRFNILRMLRIIRLFRVLRLARLLHLVGELRVLVVSIASSLRPLFWAMVLLFLFTFIFGVFLTDLVTEWKSSHSDEFEKHPVLEEMFGSLDRTMLSLYETVSDGIHWGEVLKPLAECISPWMTVGFVLYMAFSLFALMNVITGIFVESACRAAEEEKQKVLVEQMKVLFEEADEDKSGLISFTEFRAALQKDKLQKAMKELEIRPDEALDLFELIDSDDAGQISSEQLAGGTLQITGTASAIKLAIFMKEYKQHAAVIFERMDGLERHMKRMMA
eukprot:gnl/TRDRNA2_/TRDRNA2_45737_c0_seq2.p1 gnl/TRDRNA2_/TRDRNA2_45737_c0~~gnl/TRDRNA2_/TRDRNA2_45737_c0_seq2.p1  ORF type:complete len:405 (+),score=69.54 gnl/TRDRNA2_/TRDRNA2_45737_c0_seq2:926-2140(+)